MRLIVPSFSLRSSVEAESLAGLSVRRCDVWLKIRQGALAVLQDGEANGEAFARHDIGGRGIELHCGPTASYDDCWPADKSGQGQ